MSTRPGFKKKKKKSELTSPHLRCFSPFSVPVSCFSSVKCFALCVVSPVSLCSHSPRQLFPTFFPPQTPLSSPRTHVASFFSDDHGQPPLPTTPAVSGVAALRFPSHLLCQMDGQSLLWSFLPEPQPSPLTSSGNISPSSSTSLSPGSSPSVYNVCFNSVLSSRTFCVHGKCPMSV